MGGPVGQPTAPSDSYTGPACRSGSRPRRSEPADQADHPTRLRDGAKPSCCCLSTRSGVLERTPMASYYVDPVEGVDGELPRGTARNLPWKTVRWASEKIRQSHPVSQAGVELNLRAGVLHPFSVFDKLKGTAEQPLVIQPYGGDTITFDGSEPALREPGAWTAVPGRVGEWVSAEFTTAKDDRIALGRMTGTRQLLIAYSELEDLRATNESYVVTP